MTQLTFIEWHDVKCCLGISWVKFDGILLQSQDMCKGELVKVLQGCQLVLGEVFSSANLLHLHHHLSRPCEDWKPTHLRNHESMSLKLSSAALFSINSTSSLVKIHYTAILVMLYLLLIMCFISAFYNTELDLNLVL